MRSEIRITGVGGQGAITAGHLLGYAAVIHDHKEAVVTEGYSPYITGGWSRADVVISDAGIDYPLLSRFDALVTMYQEGLDTNWASVKQSGTILVERSMVNPLNVKDRRVLAIPAIETAVKLGRKVVANIVLLGALTATLRPVSEEGMKGALAGRFPKAVQLNTEAFDAGFQLASKAVAGPEVEGDV